ncbi:MAG: histidine--tRNA ligase [Pyrinomonadaceae bacterium]
MSKTQPARGMRDFLPADVRKREYVIKIIKEVYESYGFEPLETPSVENLETLTGKYGEEGSQLIFKILKRGEKLDLSQGEKGLSDLALRYDLTVPLARVVANYKNDLPKFFKRYQIQPVWRADRPAKGRYREFYQCDVDAIGSKSMLVEAELISAVSEILRRLGFEDFEIQINHRKVLTGILNAANVPIEKHVETLITLDKLDKIGMKAIISELIQKGISPDSADKLAFVTKLDKVTQPDNESIFLDWENDIEQLLKNKPEQLQEFREGKDELRSILNLEATNQELSNVKLNPYLARGLSYYTGAIMEVVLTKGDFSGSIAGGGRYDGLIGMFGKEQIPACGVSIGLERIIVVMEERGMFPEDLLDAAADVMVTIWDEDSAGESLKLAGELRQQGLRVLVYPEADKLGKQFKYASQINVSFVCVLGDEELKENKVTLKNMRSGEQETVSREGIKEKIKT